MIFLLIMHCTFLWTQLQFRVQATRFVSSGCHMPHVTPLQGKMRRFLSRIGHFTFSGTENECLFVLQPSHKLYASSLPPLTAADAGELPAGASAADSIAYWKGEATFLIAQSEAAISSLACCGRGMRSHRLLL